MRPSCHTGLLAFVATAFIVIGCSENNTNAPAYKNKLGKPVPTFSLVDVNPTSATYDREVSPRDYLKKVTAWYFGAST
jgi:hypothetical protein